MKINLHFENSLHSKKIIHAVQKIPVLAGENTFASFLILLIVAILIATAVFYKYALLVNSASTQPQASQTAFQEQRFSKVLENLDIQAVKFREIDFKQYPNIFLSPTSTTATTTGLTE